MDWADDVEEFMTSDERIGRRVRPGRHTRGRGAARKKRRISLGANGRSARRNTFHAIKIGKVRGTAVRSQSKEMN